MVAIIPYHELKNHRPLAAVDFILKEQKWKFKELKAQDLFCELNMYKHFVELNFIDVHLRGVYLFFEGNDIRYIGKAKDGFYSRFMGHTDTTFRANFGWNALLRKIGSARTNKGPNELSTDDHNIDFYTMIEYKLVLIDVELDGDDEEKKVISKLEKMLMRAFEYKQPNKIFNTRFGRFNLNDDKQKIVELIG